jgi:hypothetical protein
MTIPDHISQSLETIFWVKILKFFDADLGIFFDPGSGIRDPGWKNFGSGIRDKHPRSAIDTCHKLTHIWLKFEKTFSDVGTITDPVSENKSKISETMCTNIVKICGFFFN